jgi:Coenzyme PQQ synthesis protein D (PqqD)
MTEPQDAFTPNRDDVAAKVIDGELIIIRLSDGTYYSMDNVGSCAWQLIEAGHPVPDLVRTLSAWYATPLERVESDVAGLVRELIAERLIVAAPAANLAQSAVAPPPAGSAPYETPRLNVYRDMGNLLALDPPTPGIDDLLFRDPKAD